MELDSTERTYLDVDLDDLNVLRSRVVTDERVVTGLVGRNEDGEDVYPPIARFLDIVLGISCSR